MPPAPARDSLTAPCEQGRLLQVFREAGEFLVAVVPDPQQVGGVHGHADDPAAGVLSEREHRLQAHASLDEIAATELEVGVVVQVADRERGTQAFAGPPAQAHVDRGVVGDSQ